MIIKIVTDCNFAGCDTIHYVSVSDDLTEDQIQEMADQMMEDDIQPSNYWEISDEEEADEEGCDIE